MILSLLNILSVIILCQLTLLALFLFTIKKGKKTSNRLLAFFFVLLIINIADGLLTYHGLYTRFPQYAHLEDGFVFLFGPVLYFYTLSIVYKDFQFSRQHLLHGIPFVLVTAVYQTFYHVQSAEYQKRIQDAIVNQALPVYFYLSALLIYFHVTVYLYKAFSELKKYRIKILEKFSSIERINLNWVAYMLWSLAIILLFSLVYTFLPAVGLKEYFLIVFALVFLFMFVFINGVVWKGLRQPEIFAGVESEPITTKKSRDQLNAHEQKEIQDAIEKSMLEAKVYLNPDLTLDGLAERIGYPPRKVSQVINDTFHQNFFDFVNTYRIKEAERIFSESNDAKITVLEVMYASGFNSKSSFNTLFKQKTGLTPSVYKRTVRESRP